MEIKIKILNVYCAHVPNNLQITTQAKGVKLVGGVSLVVGNACLVNGRRRKVGCRRSVSPPPVVTVTSREGRDVKGSVICTSTENWNTN